VVGLIVWPVFSLGFVFLMDALGLYPDNESGKYAACLAGSLLGFSVGAWVNGWIRDRFPKFDRWNCP